MTFASSLPGMDHSGAWWEAEEEDGGAAAGSAPVMSASVDEDFFEAFGARIIAGRGFDRSDVRSDRRVAVVNEHFASRVLRGGHAVGARIRPRGARNRSWWEIVGVVSNLGMDTDRDPFHPGFGPGVYFPLRPAATLSDGGFRVRVAFRVRGDARSFAPLLRDIAAATDPALRLYDVLPLDRPIDQDNRTQRLITRFATSTTALAAAIALLVSGAGIYSVLSFTVSQRTREIGIRIALGADRRRIISGVFSRALLQIAAGILIGAAVWFYLIVDVLGEGDQIALFAAAALVLLLIGTAACGVPVRRALRIEPLQALREG